MESAPDVAPLRCSRDRELEEILRLAEGGIDEETKRFIEEVLKFVPVESQPELEVFTSYQGAGDASQERNPEGN